MLDLTEATKYSRIAYAESVAPAERGMSTFPHVVDNAAEVKLL
jgi:hypothetical protein